MEDRVFSDLPEYLKQGDVLVINNSKVIPARLFGQKASGAHIEILLLKQLGVKQWECLVRPGKRLKPGTQVTIGEMLTAVVGEYLIDGKRIVDFDYPESMNFFEILDKLGEMPIPPYITRKLENKDDYQTIYAKPLGSAAAPTAGLHFTEELLDKVREMGVQIAEVTLHVGLGTFRPV